MDVNCDVIIYQHQKKKKILITVGRKLYSFQIAKFSYSVSYLLNEITAHFVIVI